MPGTIEVLSGRVITAVEEDDAGALLRFGSDCMLRIDLPVRLEPECRKLADLSGRQVTNAKADETAFSLSAGDIQLLARIADLKPGAVEGVILTASDLIIVWP